MGPLEKLFRARTLFEQNPDFKALIITVFLNVKLKRLRIVLKDGTKIYIQYNNYEEYSYSVLFSGLEGDRCRFDIMITYGRFPLDRTTITHESLKRAFLVQ